MSQERFVKIRTAISGVVVAALAATGAAVISPASAQAAWACQEGYVCIYQNRDLTGTVAVLPELHPGDPRYTGAVVDFRNYQYTNGTNLNDSASSVYNRTGHTIWFYEHGNFNRTK